MAAWRAVLLLVVSASALTTPPTQSLRKAIDEAKSVKRKDREAQAIDRAVARVTRDMDRVDFSSDRRGALERREKVALGAATAVAAGATLTAAIGGYKEWGALRAEILVSGYLSPRSSWSATRQRTGTVASPSTASRA